MSKLSIVPSSQLHGELSAERVRIELLRSDKYAYENAGTFVRNDYYFSYGQIKTTYIRVHDFL